MSAPYGHGALGETDRPGMSAAIVPEPSDIGPVRRAGGRP